MTAFRMTPLTPVLAQASLEVRLLLRNGEQLVLTLAIPLLLLALLAAVDDRGVDGVTPPILALSVLSTAFTGQAIATGFERRYGALKFLASTPLRRSALLAGKTLAVLAIEAVQVVLVCVMAAALGWSPEGNAAAVGLLLLVGTAACSGLGLLMAGVLRAEATLAAANLLYVVLLLVSGVAFPLERFPAAVRPWLEATPLGALASGLTDVLGDGAGVPWGRVGVLLAWAAVTSVAAARTFRWE